MNSTRDLAKCSCSKMK